MYIETFFNPGEVCWSIFSFFKGFVEWVCGWCGFFFEPLGSTEYQQILDQGCRIGVYGMHGVLGEFLREFGELGIEWGFEAVATWVVIGS